MLKGKSVVQATSIKHATINSGMRFKAFEKLSLDSQLHVSIFSQAGQVQGSISVDGPRMDSSVSFNSREDSRILDQASFLPGLEHGRLSLPKSNQAESNSKKMQALVD